MRATIRTGLDNELLPLGRLLDEAREMVSFGDVVAGMNNLFQGLWQSRIESSTEEWRRKTTFCVHHPIRGLVHEDPITRRSYLKPRGYPGDAELLDLIYGDASANSSFGDELSPLGSQIYSFTSRDSSASAVRTRRHILSRLIDEIAPLRRHPRILSVAAVHLREASFSSALRDRRIREFVALDQDEKSLLEAMSCYGRYGITTVQSSIRPLLTGKHHLGNFDLIYSTGLYDYLNAATARRLTAKLFAMLRPGGLLTVTNFLKNIPAVGYMESFMDWWLILRDEDELASLDSEIHPCEVAQKRVFVEPNQNIIFLVLSKT